MNSSFVDLLESMRYPTDKNVRKQHKKRLDVAAGKSIVGTDEISIEETNNADPSSVDNIIEEVVKNSEDMNTISPEDSEDMNLYIDQPSTSKNVRKNNKKRRRKVEYCSSDSDSKENMNFSVHDSSSDYECLDDVFLDAASSPSSEGDSFSVGDFLLVEFKTKGKKRGQNVMWGKLSKLLRLIFTLNTIVNLCENLLDQKRQKILLYFQVLMTSR